MYIIILLYLTLVYHNPPKMQGNTKSLFTKIRFGTKLKQKPVYKSVKNDK